MKNLKKLVFSVALSLMLGMSLVGIKAEAPLDPSLDNRAVSVYKNFITGEEYTGMGKHATECFKKGIGLDASGNLRKVYTKELKVLLQSFL